MAVVDVGTAVTRNHHWLRAASGWWRVGDGQLALPTWQCATSSQADHVCGHHWRLRRLVAGLPWQRLAMLTVCQVMERM